MFTKNWYIGIAAAMCGKTSLGSSNFKFKTCNGSIYERSSDNKNWILMGFSNDNSAAYSPLKYLRTSLGNYGGVILGNGVGQSTLDDYNLSGNIITGGYTYNSSVVSSDSENGMKVKAIYTITNTSSADITISEIGMVACPDATYSSTRAEHKCLLEHTFLDEPVTIPANGGIGQVVYTIEIPIP